MYYLSRKTFRKEIKSIYKRLFCGFSFIDCHLKNKENKYKEHFAEPLKLRELPKITTTGDLVYPVKKEAPAKSEYSYCYSLPREDRLNKLNHALAVTLGFKNFFEYKRKIKFKIDKDNMKDLNDMSFDDYITFMDRFKSNLKKEFKFTKDMNINLQFLYSIYNHNKDNLLNDKKPFIDSLGYFYKDKKLTTNKLLDLESLSDLEKEQLKIVNSLNIEHDLYVRGNDKFHFLTNTENQNLMFFKNINFMYEIFNFEDNIRSLSESDYQEMLEISKVSFYKEFIQVLKKIRENKNSDFSLFLKKLNQVMKES